jgi:hypothetical protein
MKRADLEHLIRAAAQIADDDELIIVGSQSVLGQFPDASSELLRSVEADMYPKNHPERWELIDGSIGELSPFHDTFGYYAQGVQPGTAILPRGWEERVIPIRNPNTRNATGWCLEIHDLLISKYVAGRHKDQEFTAEAVRQRMADKPILLERLSRTILEEQERTQVLSRIESDYGR